MSISCFKCKNPANIKINVLKYCNSCFLHLFESKLQKYLPKIHSNSSIFLYLNNSLTSSIILNFFYKNFHNRPTKKIEIYFENENSEVSFDSNLFVKSSQSFESISNLNCLTESSPIVDYCVQNNFDFLIYGESLNNTVLNSLVYLCEGEPELAIKSSVGSDFRGFKVINLFTEIKQKDLAYYAYLNKIEVKMNFEENDKISEILNNFLNEVDEKNGLTFFNIKNTFEKLSE